MSKRTRIKEMLGDYTVIANSPEEARAKALEQLLKDHPDIVVEDIVWPEEFRTTEEKNVES